MSPGDLFRAGVASRTINYSSAGLFKLLGIPRKEMTRPEIQTVRVEALALAIGKEPALIVTYDFLANRKAPDAMSMRIAISKKCGCDPMRILFSGTHCHSSWYEVNPSEPNDVKNARQEFDAGVARSILEACDEACRRMMPSEIAYGRVPLNGAVSECRRMVVSNGTVLNCWGMGAPAFPGIKFFDKAIDDIDDAVDFLAVRRTGENLPFAVLTGYGSHIHLLPVPYVNAEVAGWVKALMEERIPGVTALYSAHAAGDVTMQNLESPPINGTEAEDMAWQNMMGRMLAELFVNPVVERIKAAEYTRPRFIAHESYRCGTWGGTPPLMVVHALALGDIALVNFKPELFSHYGKEIRKRSPFSKLLLTGYNESDYAYVGTLLNLEQGGYEMTKSNTGRPETGELTVEMAIRMLEKIKRRSG